MNKCEKYEKILPLYIDGDLTESEMKDMEDHIEKCLSCSAALDQYLELERSLAGLRSDLPDPSRLAASVIKRLKLKNKRFHISSIFRTSVLSPALTTAAAIAALIFHRELEVILRLLSSRYASQMEHLVQTGSESAVKNLSVSLTEYCNSMAGFVEALGSFFLRAGEIDQWSIISISASMTLIILLWVIHLTKRILQD